MVCTTTEALLCLLTDKGPQEGWLGSVGARTLKSMIPETRAAFEQFLVDCGEGRCDWPYLDQSEEPILTTAIGCAIFTLAAMCGLPWMDPDGSPSSQATIQAAWVRVHAHPELAKGGGGAYAALTTIRLAAEGIDALVDARIAAFEARIRPAYPGYDSAPQAAQEGMLRLEWATGGAGFAARWPKFTAAFNAGQWAVCAKECTIPGLKGEPTANAREAALFMSLVTT